MGAIRLGLIIALMTVFVISVNEKDALAKGNLCASLFAEPAGVLKKAESIHESNLYMTMIEVGGDAGTFGLLAQARGGLAKTLFKFEIPHAKEYSKALYSTADPRAVSEARLAAMLEKSHAEMVKILAANQPTGLRLSAFANTVMTSHDSQGYGWLGMRLPIGNELIEIHLNATLNTVKNIEAQQNALGVLGLNLIFGSANHLKAPGDIPAMERFLSGLSENQSRASAININTLSIYRVKSTGLERLSLSGVELGVSLIGSGAARSVLIEGGELKDPATLLYSKKIDVTNILQSEDILGLSTRVQKTGEISIARMKISTLSNSQQRKQLAENVAKLNQLGYVVELRDHLSSSQAAERFWGLFSRKP